jgi:hypothetical protein
MALNCIDAIWILSTSGKWYAPRIAANATDLLAAIDGQNDSQNQWVNEPGSIRRA